MLTGPPPMKATFLFFCASYSTVYGTKTIYSQMVRYKV